MTSVLNASAPVKIVIERRVPREAEPAFTNWAARFVTAAQQFRGHEGASVFGGHDGWHLLLLRYATPADLDQWQRSPEYNALLREADEISSSGQPTQVQSGMETWFTLPDAPAPRKSPAKWKMALVTWVCLLPMVLVVGILLAPVPLTPILQTALLTAICVSLLAWVVMPRVTKMLYTWLYPSATTERSR